MAQMALRLPSAAVDAAGLLLLEVVRSSREVVPGEEAMKWLLILWMMRDGVALAITERFKSRDACFAAGVTVQLKEHQSRGDFNTQVTFVCVEDRGSPTPTQPEEHE